MLQLAKVLCQLRRDGLDKERINYFTAADADIAFKLFIELLPDGFMDRIGSHNVRNSFFSVFPVIVDELEKPKRSLKQIAVENGVSAEFITLIIYGCGLATPPQLQKRKAQIRRLVNYNDLIPITQQLLNGEEVMFNGNRAINGSQLSLDSILQIVGVSRATYQRWLNRGLITGRKKTPLLQPGPKDHEAHQQLWRRSNPQLAKRRDRTRQLITETLQGTQKIATMIDQEFPGFSSERNQVYVRTVARKQYGLRMYARCAERIKAARRQFAQSLLSQRKMVFPLYFRDYDHTRRGYNLTLTEVLDGWPKRWTVSSQLLEVWLAMTLFAVQRDAYEISAYTRLTVEQIVQWVEPIKHKRGLCLTDLPISLIQT